MSIQQFCLRWNNHQPNFISVFTSLLNDETLVDVTLAAEGQHLQAHKVVLSACSTYFQSLFVDNPSKHPIVILNDITHSDLKVLVHFMYYGEVNVSQEQLPQILDAARMLKIKGLTDMSEPCGGNANNTVSATQPTSLLTPSESSWHSDAQPDHGSSPHPSSPTGKRKRLRIHSRSPTHERNIEPILKLGNSTAVQLEPTNFTTAPFCLKAGTAIQANDFNISKDRSMEGHLIIEDEEQKDCSMIRVTDPTNETQIIPTTPQQWSNIDGSYQRFTATPFNSNDMPPFNINTLHSQELPIGMQGMINPYEYSNTIQTQSHQNSEVVRNSPVPSVTNAAPHDNQSAPTTHKRRRSTNPQSEQNFQEALEAVRVGGIGFCKAARMFGVNNRTLWLEYKKKGYPNDRPSIKSRVKQEHTSPAPDENPPTIPDQQLTLLCQPHPVSMISFIDQQPVDFTSGVQSLNRPRFVDDPMNLHNSPLNLHGINFNSLQ